jgi:peroxiredoxin
LPQERFITTGGKVLDLATFQKQGKQALLVILRGFAGQVCLYCSAQTRILTEMQPDFSAAETEIIFVYPGPASSIATFLEAVKSVGGDTSDLPHIVLDTNLKLVRSLDIGKELAKPTSILINKQGNVAYTYVGANMVDRPSGEFLLEQAKKLK